MNIFFMTKELFSLKTINKKIYNLKMSFAKVKLKNKKYKFVKMLRLFFFKKIKDEYRQ